MKTKRTSLKAYPVILCLIVGAAFLSISPTSQAQTRFQGGLNFLLGFPQGEFKDNVDKNGVGLGGEFLYSPASTPLGVGFTLGYMIYGQETRREPFSTTIPDVEVEVKTTNNILLGHLLLRAQRKKGILRPYVDGLIGFNYLFTETKIQDVGGGDEIASSTNLDDGVFSFGGGGGLMIRVYKSKAQQGGEGKIWSVLIDLRARYIVGGEAEYLKEGSIRRENGDVFYDTIKSKTDLVTAQIGVTFEF